MNLPMVVITILCDPFIIEELFLYHLSGDFFYHNSPHVWLPCIAVKRL